MKSNKLLVLGGLATFVEFMYLRSELNALEKFIDEAVDKQSQVNTSFVKAFEAQQSINSQLLEAIYGADVVNKIKSAIS